MDYLNYLEITITPYEENAQNHNSSCAGGGSCSNCGGGHCGACGGGKCS